MSTSNIGEDDTYLGDLMIRIVYIFVNVNLLIILSLVNYPKGYFKWARHIILTPAFWMDKH